MGNREHTNDKRIAYTTRGDATPERQAGALGAAYAFLLDKEGADRDDDRPEDATKGPNHGRIQSKFTR